MKRIILLLLLLASTFTQGAELDPLKNHFYTGWEKQRNELSYVTMRCAAYYVTLSAYYSENASTNEDKKTAERFGELSQKLNAYSIIVAKRSGMSNDSIQSRFEAITLAYTKRLIANKQLNNNIFDQEMQNELRFCSSLEEIVSSAHVEPTL